MNTAVAAEQAAPTARPAEREAQPSPAAAAWTSRRRRPAYGRRRHGRRSDHVVRAMSNVYYGDKHAIKDVSLDIGRNQVLAMIGPSGCGKSHVPALPESHERHDRIGARDRHDHARRAGHLRQAPGRRAAARPRRHGVPEAESVPEVDLRKRRLRSAHPRARRGPRRARRDRADQSAARRPVGRGQGSPHSARARACPAASSSACASRAPSR